MSYRINPRDLCLSDQAPWQSTNQVRIAGRDLNDAITNGLFSNVLENLHVGDIVEICGYADQTYSRLNQFARLRIVAKWKKEIRFIRHGEIEDFPLLEGEPEPGKAEPKLEVVRGYHCFNVVEKKSGNVIESLKTKKEANDRLSWLQTAA